MKSTTSSKIAKTPPITRQTKILCFDLESNGLHGPVFAIGALVTDGSGKVYEQFEGRCEIEDEVDSWVKDNVLPVISSMKVTHTSYRELREAFWDWYTVNEAKSDYVLVSNGYPVEYRFLIECQEENLDQRYWQHPFPILDLTSIMIATGLDKNSSAKDIIANGNYNRHHPLHDAKVTAQLAFKALHQT